MTTLPSYSDTNKSSAEPPIPLSVSRFDRAMASGSYTIPATLSREERRAFILKVASETRSKTRS